jgi:hypothetical protein
MTQFGEFKAVGLPKGWRRNSALREGDASTGPTPPPAVSTESRGSPLYISLTSSGTGGAVAWWESLLKDMLMRFEGWSLWKNWSASSNLIK